VQSNHHCGKLARNVCILCLQATVAQLVAERCSRRNKHRALLVLCTDHT